MRLTEPTEDLLQTICEAHYARDYKSNSALRFFEVHCEDITNYVLSGEIDHEGETYGFIIEDGNNAGTVVKEWGEDVGIYQPPKPDPLTLLPKSINLPLNLLLLYFQWREEEWFKEQVRKTAYDFHFEPTNKIHSYWRNEADKHGLRIGHESEVPEWRNRLDRMAADHDASLIPLINADRKRLGMKPL